jgi:hypothetical protein
MSGRAIATRARGAPARRRKPHAAILAARFGREMRTNKQDGGRELAGEHAGRLRVGQPQPRRQGFCDLDEVCRDSCVSARQRGVRV